MIVTGVETLRPEQVWSSSLLMPPEEFERLSQWIQTAGGDQPQSHAG